MVLRCVRHHSLILRPLFHHHPLLFPPLHPSPSRPQTHCDRTVAQTGCHEKLHRPDLTSGCLSVLRSRLRVPLCCACTSPANFLPGCHDEETLPLHHWYRDSALQRARGEAAAALLPALPRPSFTSSPSACPSPSSACSRLSCVPLLVPPPPRPPLPPPLPSSVVSCCRRQTMESSFCFRELLISRELLC